MSLLEKEAYAKLDAILAGKLDEYELMKADRDFYAYGGTPIVGPPDQWVDLTGDGTHWRYFGSDGKPLKDYETKDHPGRGLGPHTHDWVDGKRGKGQHAPEDPTKKMWSMSTEEAILATIFATVLAAWETKDVWWPWLVDTVREGSQMIPVFG